MTLDTTAAPGAHPRLRTAGALIAGFATVAILSMGVDAVLHASNYYPNDGTAGTDLELAVALAYRTLFTVLGGAITGWLAPSHRLRLAMVLGIIGTVAASLGAIAMWRLGHNWYAVSLAALSIPSTALGGWLVTRFAHPQR